jgi:hypothetical protein
MHSLKRSVAVSCVLVLAASATLSAQNPHEAWLLDQFWIRLRIGGRLV